MRRKHAVLAALALLAIMVAVAACSQPAPQAVAQVRPTRTPRPTFTATIEAPTVAVEAATQVPPTQAPTATSQPSPTPVPPTATPLPPAEMTAKQSINVRRGPGTNYPVVGKIEAGAKAEVIGRNDGGNWYQFNFEGEPGWVAAELVEVTGNADGIEVAQNIPALPTAAPTRPRPTAAPRPPAAPTNPPPPPAPTFDWRLESQGQSAPQCGVPHFKGQAQYNNGSARNGVCVLIDYYGPRKVVMTGMDGVGDGNWEFAPCGAEGSCAGPHKIYVVSCPGSSYPPGGWSYEPGQAAPASAGSQVFVGTITDKCQTGQWEGIIFRSRE